MNLSFFIARRYLVKQKGAFSAFIIRIAVLATSLSVAVMLVAMAIVSGFNRSISEKLYSFMGHVHVLPFDATKANSLTFSVPVFSDTALQGAIRRLPHVAAVTPFTERPVIVQAKGGMEGLKLKGVGPGYNFLPGITTSGNPIAYGADGYAHQVLLSVTTANRLAVDIGDTVQLCFVDADAPRLRRVQVCGLYHSGMEEVDKNFGLCDTRLLQRINNWGADSINGYQVDLDDESYADTVSNYIHYNLIDPPLESYTTVENFSFIFEWLDLQKLNGAILLVIMALVSVINMGAVLVILMVDRARMIGLLKALGMTFERTRDIFLAIAALIGTFGIVLGNIIGLGICWLQQRYGFITLPEETYYMKQVPVDIIWWQVALVDIATLFLCVLCMWLPAFYIRRIHPARVLQFK